MFDWVKISDNPNDLSMVEAWRKFYDENIVRFELFGTKSRDLMIADLLFQNKKSIKLLDIGFAEHSIEYVNSENWFHGLLRKNKEHAIYGLDINKELVKKIIDLKGYANLIAGDATDPTLIVEGGNFDAIHAGDLLEHINSFSGFFNFCSNNLKPTGRIIITTPNPFSPAAAAKREGLGTVQTNMEHTCWVTPTNMNELCRRHGYKFEESHYYMNKKRSLKNRFREKIIFAKKDLYFGEYIYVISKQN
jgi:SAM-dependent methyltransferase